MRRIKIFIDNTIIPADIYAGQKIAFIFLPAGRQTAPTLPGSGRVPPKQLKVVNKSCIRLQWRMRTGV